MLHIILVILKIVGILLAALLFLVFLSVCAVLFVPLRYQISAAKDDGGIRAWGKVSWLLRLVSVTAKYQDGTPGLKVRILFLKKDLFADKGQPLQKKKQRKPMKKKKTPKKQEKTAAEGTKTEKTAGQVPEESRTARPPEPARPPAEKKQTVPESEKTFCEETQKEPESVKVPCEETQKESAKASSEAAKTSCEKAQTAPEGKSFHPLRMVSEKLRAFWNRLKELFEKLKEIPEKIRRILERGKAAWGKVNEWLTFLFSDPVKGVFHRFRRHFLYLWKHWKPDKIRGELRYGFEDPSLTGQFTGLLYLLLPSGCCEVRLQPDFQNALYEGELHIKGHIRICHLARVGWKVFRDKDFRKILKKFQA